MQTTATHDNIGKRFSRLNAAQRSAVYQKIRAEGLTMGQFPIGPRDEALNDTSPASYAQLRQWFLWQLEPGSTAYHIAGALRLTGKLDISALEASFSALLERHEALRTVFSADSEGALRQHVLKRGNLDYSLIDLSGCADSDTASATDAAVRSFCESPFDLTSGPLLRIGVVRLSESNHILTVVMHHIISDGWSMRILVDEFVGQYCQRVLGDGSENSTLPIQYADYALWQHQWLEAGEKDRQLTYWMEQLGATHPVLQLPCDHARSVNGKYRAARHPIVLPAALVIALRKRAQDEGATLFMVMLAGLQVLLYRYTAQVDIRVGVPIANRHRVETESVVGLFVNTQVLRNRIDGRSSLRGALHGARDAALGAQAHQDLPFEQLVEALQPDRSLGTAPLFQVMFNYQREDHAALHTLPDLIIADYPLGEQAAHFELALNAAEDSGGQIRLGFDYARELFDEATIVQMGNHFQGVLQALADRPDTCIGALELLAPEEQQQLNQWGINLRAETHVEPVHRLVQRRAAQAPQATAVIFERNTLSYAELECRANQMAHHLIALGVRPETRVGIAIERSLDMVVGLLAILKTGAAYVPMDTEYPTERLAHMAKDSGVEFLLTQAQWRTRIPVDEGVQIVEFDGLSEAPGNCAAPEITVHPGQLAYVIYTSGSTGTPKGVMVEHGAFAAHCVDTALLYEMGPNSCELHFLSFSFDGAHERLFTALCCGASLLVRDVELWSAEQTLDSMQKHAVTNAGFPPVYLRQLADWARETGECPPVDLYSFGGEAMSREGFDAVRQHLKPRLLINGYGPTEAVVTPMLWKVDADAVFEEGYAPIGRPVSGRKALVLDTELNRVPRHVAGELYLGGSGLARGYLDRAGLSAERFVADPLDDKGGRLYRTGDWVRWRADGQLEYLGRIDQQVKIRGFRIELGEVEAHLLAQPEVRQAVVVATAAAAQGSSMRLLAYVSLRERQTIDASVLRDRLVAVLPNYMVPSLIMLIDTLPLSPNGKVDRQALPALAESSERPFIAPCGEAEEALAGVWCDVLGLPRVAREENFFELGGDSILSLQIVARLKMVGWRITPKQLFERQTVAQLAVAMERAQGGEGRTTSEIQGTVPLLPFQRDFFGMDMPVRGHWNQSVLLQSRGAMQWIALGRALRALVLHHDGLRLRFAQTSQGAWRQEYGISLETELADLLWVRTAADAGQLEALCEQVQRSLDLERGPLLRALAVELPDGSSRLMLAIHHLVVDGVSWRVLLQDLELAYRQSVEGREIVLPAKSSSVKDWALALQAYTATLDDEMSHWRALADASASMPCARSDGDNTLKHQQSIELRLDRATTQALLKQAPAAYRTQVNDLLLTALGRTLCTSSGQTRVLVDLEGHGREDLFSHIDLSRTVGWLTALFPVALEPTGDIGSGIQRVKESLRAIPNKGLGYGVLRHMGTAEQQAALQVLPKAQVVFNYLGQFDGDFGDDALWAPAQEKGGAQVDADAPLTHEFSIDGQVLEGQLSLRVSFSAARHDVAAVQAWVDLFRDEIESIVRHCAQGPRGVTPSDFPLAGVDQQTLDALPLPAAALVDLYPLSPMQSGMLFQSLLDDTGSAYQNQLRMDLHGLDATRFREAWQAVFERYEVLRTGFLQQADRPLQWVDRRATLPWREEDWRAAAPQALIELARDEQARAFDLACAPLTRFVLLRTGERRHHFVWTVHHLLLDGWSTSQLLGDVLRHYGGKPLTPATGRFRDYLGWIAAQDVEANEQYWRRETARLEGPTRLVDGLPKPERDGRVGMASLRHDFDAQSTQSLLDFAKRERVTLNTLVQAAWALLLQRYCRQDTVTFGATVSGRPGDLPGVERIVGLFINTLPVICTVHPQQSVGDWLRALQAGSMEMREHEHTPLYEIQRWAQAPAPGLFDSIVVFENYPADRAVSETLPDDLLIDVIAQHEETHYPMTLKVALSSCLELQFNHALEVVGARETQAIARHMEQLLTALSVEGSRVVGDICMADDAENAQVRAWGEATSSGPALPTLHQLITAQANARPNATALVFEEQEITYGELEERANRIAHALIARGVGLEARVGVGLDRGIELVVTLLAVLKAGAAYVPLDPTVPAERIVYMAKDSGLSLVLTRSHLLSTMALPEGVSALAIDTLDLLHCPVTDPAVPVHGDGLAYVIYTSGSTGKPKGAQLSHRNVTRLLARTASWFNFGTHDVWTLFHSYAFDFSVWEIFGSLCTGAKLVIVPYWISRSPEDFERLLRAHKVTVLNQTPSAFGHLSTVPEALRGGLALRWVIFGGEALEPQRLRSWIEHHGDDCPQLVNMYGITETTVHVTFRRILATDVIAARSPVGTAISDLGVQVLDAQLNPLPVGVAGELHVSGAGLARGYWKRAGLTAERFVATEKGERLYRTGDLVRWTPAGQLDYLGRIDHQVKLRGFRIELGEIEAQLLAQSEVREAIVIAREHAGSMQLVAYLSAHADKNIGFPELRTRLGNLLPDYMVPSAFVALETLPLNANGKVDRHALPAPVRLSERAYALPQGEMEQMLAQTWADVLELERVGRDDDFFALGGHSLSVLSVQTRMQQHWGIQVPLKLYFEHSSLAALAQALTGVMQTMRHDEADDLVQMAALLETLEN